MCQVSAYLALCHMSTMGMSPPSLCLMFTIPYVFFEVARAYERRTRGTSYPGPVRYLLGPQDESTLSFSVTKPKISVGQLQV